jgi:McrBC 5-methylcytosine restriction system component
LIGTQLSNQDKSQMAETSGIDASITARFFRVSNKGDSSGIAFLTVSSHVRETLFLRIDVLPKFWGYGDMVSVNLDELENLANKDDTVTVEVYEKQVLKIFGSDEKRLSEIGNVLAGISFNVDGDELEDEFTEVLEVPNQESKRTIVTLFSEITEPDSSVRGSSIGGSASEFWEIVLRSNIPNDRIKVPAESELGDLYNSSLAQRLLENIPALRSVLRRSFLVEAERLASRLRPVFRQTSEELQLVRGTINTSSLHLRRFRATPAILCEFDELEVDSPWYELVRCANLIALSEESDSVKWSERAARVDYHLSKVQKVPRSIALRQVSNLVPRNLKHFALCFRLAKLLILEEAPVGGSQSIEHAQTGLVVSLRISTSKLFEQLLNDRPLGPNHKIRLARESVSIHSSGRSKRPDLELIDTRDESSPVMFLDAKYKRRATSDWAMGFADQYQQYAYAAATGLDTFFIYVGTGTVSKSRIYIGREISSIRVGVASVNFPTNGDLVSWWQESARSLNQILEQGNIQREA